MDIEKLTDEQLVTLSQNQNNLATEMLFDRYKNTVKAISRSYFLSGGDKDDLFQEGLIGFFKAISTYRQNLGDNKASFKNYAVVCIRNNVVSLIKTHNTLKNRPLLNYVSLTAFTDGDSDKNDIVVDGAAFNPETDYINREALQELQGKINGALSKLENEILISYLNGYSYLEIADQTGKNVKSIDNAIQRIRNKVYAIIS